MTAHCASLGNARPRNPAILMATSFLTA